jgi:hypothetical protein
MTYINQDIMDGFYSGNKKIIRVKVYNQDGSLKDLGQSEITYAIFTRDANEVILRKTSYNGDVEVKVVGLGLCERYLKAPDTAFIHGTFRHHVNVVDEDEYEATVLSGVVRIHQAPAKRFRQARDGKAYLEGIAS